MRAAGLAAALVAGLLATACGSGRDRGSAPVPAAPPEADTAPRCQPSEFAYLVGRDRSEVPTDRLPPSARVVGPDDILTLDYNPNRLNIVYNASGVITEVKCG